MSWMALRATLATGTSTVASPSAGAHGVTPSSPVFETSRPGSRARLTQIGDDGRRLHVVGEHDGGASGQDRGVDRGEVGLAVEGPCPHEQVDRNPTLPERVRHGGAAQVLHC